MNFKDYLQKGYLNRKYDIEKKNIENFIDDFFHFIFLLDYHRCCSSEDVKNRLNHFKVEFENIISSVVKDENIEELAQSIFDKFVDVYALLQQDAQTFLDSDPAATSLEEIYFAYPGFYAIAVYRLAHEIQRRNIPLIPRIWTEFAHSKTGIDIHPSAEIGKNIFIDHGTGIVIGETTIIGNYVKIYQGVTLGALSVSKDVAHKKRHPTIEDNVTIYSNATILGGETTIGKCSVIGGNVWITESVAPESIIYHKGQVTMKNKTSKNEPINFVI